MTENRATWNVTVGIVEEDTIEICFLKDARFLYNSARYFASWNGKSSRLTDEISPKIGINWVAFVWITHGCTDKFELSTISYIGIYVPFDKARIVAVYYRHKFFNFHVLRSNERGSATYIPLDSFVSHNSIKFYQHG